MGQQVSHVMLCGGCNGSGSPSPRRRRISNTSSAGHSPTRQRVTSFSIARGVSDIPQDLVPRAVSQASMGACSEAGMAETLGVVPRGRMGKDQMAAWSNLGMAAF
mmetsp:Transcript_69363/g.176174  ORF Transcript_69363/g.176174 Transcript_69363/m.176174 type:complete len:105 (+) Transcript_69363:83-397(+)